MSTPRAVPRDFSFREVTAPETSLSEGRALEQIHKMLQSESGERFAVRNAKLRVEGFDNGSNEGKTSTSLMILGIMSGHEGRRRLLRCTWSRASEVRSYLRVLFAVGSATPLANEWEYEPPSAADPGSIALLRVNISEGVRVWNAPPGSKMSQRQHQSFTGTFSTYFKQAAFLRFAATQPEPLIGRADDDAFISPHMLLAYAHLLNKLPHPLYGGVFEWISWRAPKLEATGFSYGLSEARGRAKAPHRNCSRTVPDPNSAAYDHFCLGPFGCECTVLPAMPHSIHTFVTRPDRAFSTHGFGRCERTPSLHEPAEPEMADPSARVSSRPTPRIRYGRRARCDPQGSNRRRHQFGLLDGAHAESACCALPSRGVEGHLARWCRSCIGTVRTQAPVVDARRNVQQHSRFVALCCCCASICYLSSRCTTMQQLLSCAQPTCVRCGSGA